MPTTFLTDNDKIVRYDQQTLASEEKSLARENIDAAPTQFVLTLTYNSETGVYTSDKTFAELEAAYDAGSQIRAVTTNGMEFEMTAFASGYMAYFTHYLSGTFYRIGLRANDTTAAESWVIYDANNPPSPEDVGAKSSIYAPYSSGDIREWAEAQEVSATVGVPTSVTNMPETGSKWVVDLIVASRGLWRKLTATKLVSGSTPVTYESTYIDETWSDWVLVSTNAIELTADRVLVSDNAGHVSASEITVENLNNLTGLTQNVQNELSTLNSNLDSAVLATGAIAPGSLTWDGVIGDKEHVIVDQFDQYNICFVRVYDEYPPFSPGDQVPYTMVMNEAGYVFGAELVGLVSEDGIVIGEAAPFVIIPNDNCDLAGTVFPKKGIYFMAYHCAPMGLDVSMVYICGLNLPIYRFPESGGANNYFEKVADTAVCGDTLTWDGDTTGLTSFSVHLTSTATTPVTYYKVSDSVPSVTDYPEDMSTVLYSIANGGELSDGSLITAHISDDGYLLYLPICVAPTDNYVVTTDAVSGQPVMAPESGIYFLHDNQSAYTELFTIPGYTFTTFTAKDVIKTEHLPKALRFGDIETTTYSDTLTWDGNTTGLESIGAQVFRVSDVVPTIDDFYKGFKLDITLYGSTTAEECHEYSAEEAINAVAYADDGYIVLPNGVGYVFMTPQEVNGITLPVGTYLLASEEWYISSLTINDYNGFSTTSTELVKIDPKYLPDDIGGGSGLPEVSESDEGKTLIVNNGAWSVEQLDYNDLSNKPTLFSGNYNDLSNKPIPNASASPNGAFLRVVNGVWTAVVLPNAEDGEF